MDRENLATIQSLWIGKELSIMEQLSISSFLQNGHGYELYVYDEIKNVPAGVIIKDADKIITPDKIFKYKKFDSYAAFSNIFRYKLLLENGGYWADTDIICLQPLHANTDYIFATERRRIWRGWSQVATCLLKTPANCQLMDYCYQESVKRNPTELEWGDTGPKLVTQAVKRFKLTEYLLHPYYCCPINFWQSERLISDSEMINWWENRKINRYQSRAIHLWNEMWRRGSIDKNGQFPSNSIYEQLKKRYLGL